MKRISAFFITLVITVMMTFVSAAAATKNDCNSSVMKAMEFMKNELKSEYTDEDGSLTADSWSLATVFLCGDKIYKSQFYFLIPEFKSENLPKGSKGTDYANYIFGILMLDKNPASYLSGRNIVDELVKSQDDDGFFSFENESKETIRTSNDQVWAMIALDTVGAQYDKAKAISALKSMQNADKGFSFFGDKSGVDLTGMAIIALSKHKDNEDADSLISDCIGFIKSTLQDDGALLGKGDWDSKSSCSQAYGIIGLVAAGEDVFSGEWSVDGISVVDNLLANQDENGGFWNHISDKGNSESWFKEPDSLSTVQSIIALSAASDNKVLFDVIKDRIDDNSPDDKDGQVDTGREYTDMIIALFALMGAVYTVSATRKSIKKKTV